LEAQATHEYRRSQNLGHMIAGLILVAAGRGLRAGGGVAKQYRLLGGVPLARRALQPFLDAGHAGPVVIVIGKGDEPAANAAFADLAGGCTFVTGGATRQQSVHNGLAALPSMVTRVLVHDAARPFVTTEDITNLLAVPAKASATLAAAIHDSLRREVSAGASDPLDRKGIHAVLTPQLFPRAEFAAAHEAASAEGRHDYTDDCSLMQAHGYAITLVAGSRDNFKITEPADFEKGERMLESLGTGLKPRLPDVRVGQGYDIHTLGPGDHVTLCGVRIAHDRALVGHSDADVGLHALTDALLATIGAGDIGTHFPPSDPQWRGAASTIFLAHAAGLVRAAGGTINLADVTLVCEAPKVGPHRTAMVAAMAEALGIEQSRVSVKATTNERIGAIGRGEGICALASATVVFAS
jgi:2-C-methyl-D-erythritol 4-phosphate cytidylyltransferase / 2-C-methyl-D-erythritol 2,4-cyclodiphosphate synthase